MFLVGLIANRKLTCYLLSTYKFIFRIMLYVIINIELPCNIMYRHLPFCHYHPIYDIYIYICSSIVSFFIYETFYLNFNFMLCYKIK